MDKKQIKDCDAELYQKWDITSQVSFECPVGLSVYANCDANIFIGDRDIAKNRILDGGEVLGQVIKIAELCDMPAHNFTHNWRYSA